MNIYEYNVKNNARIVALVGVMAATLECGKLALSFVPNVEIVTILCALYGYVFGWYGVAAAAVFVCIEPLIHGIGPWLVTYIIYWPLVAFIFMILSKKRVAGRLIPTATALGLTVFFGVLSSVIDVALYLGINEYYLKNLLVYYLRGIVFYVVQTACNMAVFATLFPFLACKLKEIKAICRL